MLDNVTHFFKYMHNNTGAILRHTLLPTLTNTLFPPRCAICDSPTDHAPSLCATCFSNIHLISEPYCHCCGSNFTYDIGHAELCISCLTEAPLFDRARAALNYDEHSRKLITRVKFSDRSDLVALGAMLMSQAGTELLANTDIIIPVPLHWHRLLSRKYNQSQLFAQALARMHSIRCIPHGLQRTRATAPQMMLDWHERQHNVKDAFRVRPSLAATLKGKRILLIDDVFTTGATIHACTKALKKAQVNTVFVLTLARRMPTD